MPQFRVPVKTVVHQTYVIAAPNAATAMELALDACDNGDTADLVDEGEGDPEVYFPDILEVNAPSAVRPTRGTQDSVIDPRD